MHSCSSQTTRTSAACSLGTMVFRQIPHQSGRVCRVFFFIHSIIPGHLQRDRHGYTHMCMQSAFAPESHPCCELLGHSLAKREREIYLSLSLSHQPPPHDMSSKLVSLRIAHQYKFLTQCTLHLDERGHTRTIALTSSRHPGSHNRCSQAPACATTGDYIRRFPP